MVVETINKIIQQKTILFGSSGMLGHALQSVFPAAAGISHNDVDITDEKAVRKLFQRLSPDIVINAAAYTDVDGCEDNREYALSVNGRAPGYIAESCAETGATLIHFSSDYVFDGSMNEYREDERTHPLNVYGISKELGERCIQQNLENFRIVRTSWLFGPFGKNFVDTICTLSREMDVVKVVNDQFGKPTYTMDLAGKIPDIIRSEPGIYHITNDGICSWFEFASAFASNIVPCTSQDFPRKAKRPPRSVLANTKTTPLRHWKEALNEYLKNHRIC